MTSVNPESDVPVSLWAWLGAFLRQVWYAISGEGPPAPQPVSIPQSEPVPPRHLGIEAFREASADVLLSLAAEAPDPLLARALS